jgi:hypothetical protein
MPEPDPLFVPEAGLTQAQSEREKNNGSRYSKEVRTPGLFVSCNRGELLQRGMLNNGKNARH